MTSESTNTAEVPEAPDATSESPDTAGNASPDAPPNPSHAERLKRFQEAQQALVDGIREIATEFAMSDMQKWRAHRLRFAVECPASVCGIVAPNPEAAAESLRSAGFLVIELGMPFAERAVAAVWERVWWRRHRGEVPRSDAGRWMVWPGAELPLDEQGQVVLAGEAN